jgi:hypothetical protein
MKLVTADTRAKPIGNAPCNTPPMKPRRAFGTISSASVLFDVYSPPMNTPSMKRNAISSTSDQTPQVA